MNPLFAQQGGGAGGGGISISLPTPDWTTLVPQLFGEFTDAMGTWLQSTLHKTFDGVWTGDHNVVGQTPLDLTWNLGAVHAQLADVQTGARAILMFALILLGLRSILGALMHIDTLREFTNGILGSVILVSAFPLLIPQGIELVNQATGAVAGGAAIQGFVGAGANAPDPLASGVLFVILLFFAMRLLVKAAWRIMFLAVLLPVGLGGCALYAIPQTRWILVWWARVWGGMLLAQIPSVFALGIAAGTFVGGGDGIGSFVWSIAALQLATDLYSVIPFGGSGEHGTSPFAAILGGMRAGLTAAAVGSVVAGGAAASTLARTNARYPMQGSMESTAQAYGYQ